MRFSTKISLLITVIFLISFGIMTYLGYSTTTRILEQRVRENLESHAFHSMDKIDRMLFKRVTDLSMIVSDPVLRSRGSTPAQITARLQEFQRNTSSYSSLSFYNLNRIRIADTGGKFIGKKHDLNEYWADINSGKDFVMTVARSKSADEIVIYFAAKVRDGKGSPFGVVAARMPINSVYSIVEQTFSSQKARETAVIELLTEDGSILYSNHNVAGMLNERSADWPYIKSLLSEGKAVGSSRHQFEGEEEISAFAREQGFKQFKGNGWVLVMCTQLDVAFADAYRQEKRLSVLFTAIGLLILLVTFFASRTALKPLHELSVAAAEIGKGNLDVAVKVRSGDEVGQLAQAFNAMVRDLRENENKFRDLAEMLPQIVYEVDTRGKITFVNKYSLGLFGYTREEVDKGVSFLEVFSPEDRGRLVENMTRRLQGQTTDSVEYRALRKDGSTFPVLTFSIAVQSGGRVVGIRGIGVDITERKRAETALQEREAFLSNVLDSIQDGISILATDLRIVRTNRTMEQWIPRQVPFKGKLCYAAYHGRTTPCEDCPSLQTLQDGKPASRIFEYEKNGEKVWLEHFTFPLLDAAQARVVGVIEHIRDISERKQAENAIKESEEMLSTITRTAQDAIVMMNDEGKVSFWNPAAEKIFGYSDAETLGKEMHVLIGPKKYYDAYREGFARFRETGEGPAVGKRLELNGVRKDGTEFELELSLSTIQLKKKWHAVGIIRDITERKRIERELQESRERFRHIVETSSDWIWEVDARGTYTYASPKIRDILGYEPEEVYGKTPFDFMPPDEAKRVGEIFSTIAGAKKPFSFLENENLRKDGRTVVLETSGIPRLGADGSLLGYCGVDRDITERKRSEIESQRRGVMVARFNSTLVALARNENIYRGDLDPAFRTITEASADALDIARVSIWFYTEGNDGIVCRDLFERNSCLHSQGSMLKASDFPVYFAALSGEYCIAADDALSDPRTREFAESYLRPLGVSSMLDVPIQVAGKVIGVVCHEQVGPPRTWSVETQSFVTAIAGFTSMAIEVYEKKKAEEEVRKLNEQLEYKVEKRTRQLLDAQEELVRNEKLSTLGQIAGSVGHELRNPLGVMNNAVYYLQTVLADADETVKEYLGIIKSEIFGAERIVSDLLDAVRTKPPQRQEVLVEDIIAGSLGKCRIPESVKVELKGDTKRPVLVDPLQMKQVFINLISNAVDAMPNGGSLLIAARRVLSSEFLVLSSEMLKSNSKLGAEFVEITVSDTGCGMSPETTKKLFQPLYTTKARGIGLGLVVVKNLTEANGGRVTVASETGKGTVFTITLPACEGA